MRNDFKNLNFEELIQKREDLSAELMELRFKSVTGQVESPILKRTLRRQVARLNTRIYEFQVKVLKEEGK